SYHTPARTGSSAIFRQFAGDDEGQTNYRREPQKRFWYRDAGSSMMRVLIYSQIFPFPPQHGAHHRIRQLIRYFLSRNCEAHLLCHSCTWGNPFDRGAVDLNITAQLIRFPTWGHRVDTAWKRIFRLREHSIVSKVAFNRVLKDLAPDIVLMNYADSMSLLAR